jgi:hypothetical protein
MKRVRPVTKFLLSTAKAALVVVCVLFLLIVSVLLLEMPGARRFDRYCAHPDLKTLLNAEKDDVTDVGDFERDGVVFTLVTLRPCRFLASGPTVLVYDDKGRLFAKSYDEGEDWEFQKTWSRPWAQACAETIRRLKTIRMPELFFCAPSTMKDLSEYLEQATKDFDRPDIPVEERGVKFVCDETVAVKAGPKKEKQNSGTLFPSPCGGTTVSVWEVLTNVCNSVECRFDVHPGKVVIRE